MQTTRDVDVRGLVFNIQKFSVHDGAGIRTLVFLKGCGLRCQWCSNPESQRMTPEKAFNPARCLGADRCGRCLGVCPTKALGLDEEGRLVMDFSLCSECLACVRVCPSRAQSCYGEYKTVDQILRAVERDAVFYARSGGGLTLSGGEAFLQGTFALALLREAHRRHLNTAVETCGFYPYERLQACAPYLDTLIFDVKCADSERHARFTGAGNEGILANLHRVRRDFPDLTILVRTPVIPGFNDTKEDIAAILDLLPGRTGYELLAYHRLGQPKYASLGRRYPLGEARLAPECMKELQALVEERGRRAEPWA